MHYLWYKYTHYKMRIKFLINSTEKCYTCIHWSYRTFATTDGILIVHSLQFGSFCLFSVVNTHVQQNGLTPFLNWLYWDKKQLVVTVNEVEIKCYSRYRHGCVFASSGISALIYLYWSILENIEHYVYYPRLKWTCSTGEQKLLFDFGN